MKMFFCGCEGFGREGEGKGGMGESGGVDTLVDWLVDLLVE